MFTIVLESKRNSLVKKTLFVWTNTCVFYFVIFFITVNACAKTWFMKWNYKILKYFFHEQWNINIYVLAKSVYRPGRLGLGVFGLGWRLSGGNILWNWDIVNHRNSIFF